MTAKTNAFDLATIDTIAACNKPFDVEIEHPVTKQKTGIVISVVGKDSDIYRAQVKAMADENMQREATSRPGKPHIQKIDKLEAKNINALVAATVAWRSETIEVVPLPADAPADAVPETNVKVERTIKLDGEALEFSPANARAVYTQILPVRDQVQEAVNDLENFMDR